MKTRKQTHIHIGGNVKVKILNEKKQHYLLIVFHQTDPSETQTNNQSENLNCLIDYMFLILYKSNRRR